MANSKLLFILLVAVIASFVTSKPVFKRTQPQFPLADRDQNGYVTPEELKDHLGVNPLLARGYVGDYDDDRDGQLSFDEFDMSPLA